MKKSKTTYMISFLIMLSLLLTILSCDRKGSLNSSKDPGVKITEYSGISKPEGVDDTTFFHTIGDSVDSNYGFYDSLFCQTIYWNAWDVDGVVKSFAYRIGTWDSVIRDWQYDKAFGVEIDTTENYGWVLHEQPNGDSLIWTAPDERFPRATVYFLLLIHLILKITLANLKLNVKMIRVMCLIPRQNIFVLIQQFQVLELQLLREV